MPRAPKKNKKPPYRPIKEIDWEMVDVLLKAQAPGTMIAAYFNMHPQTFYTRLEIEKGMTFTQYSAGLNDQGKAVCLLREYEQMNGTNPNGTQWWAKQHLGHSEKSQQKVEVTEVPKQRALLTLPNNQNRTVEQVEQ